MSEQLEPKNQPEKPQETPRPEQKQDGKSPPRNSKKFLFFYAITLFLVAAVLILFSYLIEARNSNRTLNEFSQQQSSDVMSAMQKVEQMQEENQRLKKEVTTLTEALDQNLDELEEARENLLDTQQKQAQAVRRTEDLEEELSRQQEALTLLWSLERNYLLGYYGTCQNLVSTIEENHYEEYFSQENPANPAATPPLERYRTIKENLS